MALSAFATSTLLTKNSFLDEIRKQYVVTARAKGLREREVLYGHVFRNAMLLVISGFPGAFVSAFFAGSLLSETIFSLDGLGLLGFESVMNRDYPVVFRHALHLLADRPRGAADLRPDLYLDRSAHRFRKPRGLTRHGRENAARTRRVRHRAGDDRPLPGQEMPPPGGRASPCRRSTGAAGKAFRPTSAAFWALWIFLVLFVLSLFAEFLANDSRSWRPTRANCSSRPSSTTRRRSSAASWR
jgi:hypothetical protein